MCRCSCPALITGYQKIVAAFRWDPALSSLRLAFFVAVVIEGMTEASFRMMAPTWFALLWAMIGTSKAAPPQPSLRMEGEFECEGSVWAFGSANAGLYAMNLRKETRSLSLARPGSRLQRETLV